MRFDYFSIVGYVSVALWVIVPVLWMLHARRRPRRWLCHIALAVALLAYVLAKINSVSYVDRIQLDQSAEIAAVQAKLDEARKAAEQTRSGDVAQIRFAEDASGDFLDAGGMNSSDLKYMEKVTKDSVPEWKKEKKQRSAGGKQDDSVESLVGGKPKGDGVKSEPAVEKNPVLMLEKDKSMADRLDGLNLKIIRLLIFIGIGIVIVDYLRRANIYEEAYLPLPLPSAWFNGLTPLPPLMVQPVPARRTMPEELAWLTKRGDSFVYMTYSPEAAGRIPASLPRMAKRCCPVDIIHVNDAISDEFIFETLWYGRSSFVVDSSERSVQMLGLFMALLAQRRETHARVAQTVHIIWDAGAPLDEAWQQEFAKLTKATGMSLVVCQGDRGQ